MVGAGRNGSSRGGGADRVGQRLPTLHDGERVAEGAASRRGPSGDLFAQSERSGRWTGASLDPAGARERGAGRRCGLAPCDVPEITFEPAESILLPPGAWCPFNSQSTWWFPVAFPLLYLPSRCSFRMTDIWRSFVAQRCLWELGQGVVFHGPEVVQERNVHNLMRDFEQEVPGYLGNRRLAAALERAPLRGGDEHVAANVLACYEALVREGFFPSEECGLLELWIEEVGQAIPVGRTGF